MFTVTSAAQEQIKKTGDDSGDKNVAKRVEAQRDADGGNEQGTGCEE